MFLVNAKIQIKNETTKFIIKFFIFFFDFYCIVMSGV
nr:MAG TPA: hypothetical protein [Crassvirales sp.]